MGLSTAPCLLLVCVRVRAHVLLIKFLFNEALTLDGQRCAFISLEIPQEAIRDHYPCTPGAPDLKYCRRSGRAGLSIIEGTKLMRSHKAHTSARARPLNGRYGLRYNTMLCVLMPCSIVYFSSPPQRSFVSVVFVSARSVFIATHPWHASKATARSPFLLNAGKKVYVLYMLYIVYIYSRCKYMQNKWSL